MRPRADQTLAGSTGNQGVHRWHLIGLSAAHRHLGVHGLPRGVELDHAQDILADLMGTIVSALRPSFRLAKLEGDARSRSRSRRKWMGRCSSTPSSAATSASDGGAATYARRRRAIAMPACASPTST